jgi:hypothetical protein
MKEMIKNQLTLSRGEILIATPSKVTLYEATLSPTQTTRFAAEIRKSSIHWLIIFL